MHIVRLKISGFRGVAAADNTLGRHAVLVGPNNSNGASRRRAGSTRLFGGRRSRRFGRINPTLNGMPRPLPQQIAAFYSSSKAHYLFHPPVEALAVGEGARRFVTP